MAVPSSAKKDRKPGPRGRRERRDPDRAEGIPLLLAQSAAGEGRNDRFNKKLQKHLGVLYAYITEAQWNEIQSGAGLPHTARFEINWALRRYWREYSAELASDETRTRVDLAG